MRRWKKTVLITIGIALLLACFDAFVLPGILINQSVQRIEISGLFIQTHLSLK